MRRAHPLERAVGIEHYASDADGTGGRLRDRPGDFRVEEIEAFDPEPVGADPDAYPHVLVRATLRAWDTNDFAAALSDRLGISRERVSWAGTKDKHAVTTQLFTVSKVDPADVGAAGIDRADIEVVGRAGRPILFGDLAGNAFEVTVRDPDDPGRAGEITSELRAFAGAGADGPAGVPNYFGHQRFGSHRPVTHEVGLAIARGDWEGAVLAYVGNPSDREPDGTRAAREYVERTRDWAGALDRLPDHLGYERAICHRLAEGTGPDAFREALERLPTTLQRLFVNAAQSYAFNGILSERLSRGLPLDRPVAGDVVCFSDRDAPAGLELPDADRTQRVSADRVDTVERHCERGRAFVTAPLVGTDTDFGDGEPGEIERAVLGEVGIAPADFDLPGEFGSTGTRRAVLVRTDPSVGRDPLTLSFRLPRGSYATVLLREYLKRDPAALA